jgi:hypothetical protein
MSEGLTYPFTAEQISNQATVNANGLGFAVMAYAKEHSVSLDELWTYMGRRFAPAWEGLKGSPVSEVAKWFALNWVSLGAEVRTLSGDEAQGKVVTAGWPSVENLEAFGLTREEADCMRLAPAAIAEYLGLAFEWSREEDEVTMIFTRQSAA